MIKFIKFMILFILYTLAVGAVFTACSRGDDTMYVKNEEQPNPVVTITSQEAQRMMTTDDVIIVDVRTKEEFMQGHIDGAILMPIQTLADTAAQELGDKHQIILVYCRSGNRSKQAARLLMDMGYLHVYDFGGINTWDGEIVRP